MTIIDNKPLEYNPDAIITAVAVTLAKKCDTGPYKAFRINSSEVYHLSKRCGENNITLDISLLANNIESLKSDNI